MKNRRWHLIIVLLSFFTTFYLLNKNSNQQDIYGFYVFPAIISAFSIAMEMIGRKLAEFNKIPKKIVVPVAVSIPVLFAITRYCRYVLDSESGLGHEKTIHVLVALVIIVVGNYLPKTKPSRFVGLKFFWLLDKPVIWFQVHRLAGFLWILSGALLLSFGFTSSWVWLTVYALLLYIIPLMYSLVLIKKENKEKLK